MKNIRIISLVALAISIIVSVDLGLNYLNSTFIEKHDGVVIIGFFAPILYGDSGWSVYNFFKTFSTSMIITVFIGIANIILNIIFILKKPTN